MNGNPQPTFAEVQTIYDDEGIAAAINYKDPMRHHYGLLGVWRAGYNAAADSINAELARDETFSEQLSRESIEQFQREKRAEQLGLGENL